MKAFGIFEGGGAKGLAHTGALSAAEERNVEFIGVAGASAGAIIASLIAAGYNASELFDPNNPDSKAVFNSDLTELLDKDLWRKVKPIKDLLKSEGLSFFSSKRRLLWHIIDPRKARLNTRIALTVARIGLKQGIFETARIRDWLEYNLREKVGVRAGRDYVEFQDLPIPLSVVATDLTARTIFVFSRDYTPDVSVSEAVTASLSIPLVFRPAIFSNRQLIDGGVLSNFPAWLFDEQRKNSREFVPTFGFRLSKTLEIPADSQTLTSGIMRYLNALFATMLSGDNILEVREIEDLNLIPISVRAATLDFDMDHHEKRELYLEGRDGAHRFFSDYIGPKDPTEIRILLWMIRRLIKQCLKNDDLHLRASVWLPSSPKKDKLRVMYTYNMSKDADDRLVFGVEEGCVGRCWKEHRFIWADLVEARDTYQDKWNMTKYQQAMIRTSLSSLICVPIFDRKAFDMNKAWEDNPLIGVLAIDSDHNLLAEFLNAAEDESNELRQILVDASMLLGKDICGL